MPGGAAPPRRPRARRPARPKIALAPTLHRPGAEEDLAAIDAGFLLAQLPDGWRCLALLDDRVRVRSRAGHDLAAALPAVAAALARLGPPQGAGPTIVDGILVLPPRSEQPAPRLADVASFAVLDLLCSAGRDVTMRPLRARLELLRALRWPRDPALQLVSCWHGDARASLAQLQTSGQAAFSALLARRAASPYLPGLRSPDWISFGEPIVAEMLLCGIAASGALVLGMPLPQGLVFGGVTWPTRRWRELAQRCREAEAPFATDALWPSLGAVTWARPDLWLAVEPDVRPGSGRGGPRWRLLRVQEDLSRPGDASADPAGTVAAEIW